MTVESDDMTTLTLIHYLIARGRDVTPHDAEAAPDGCYSCTAALAVIAGGRNADVDMGMVT